MVLNDEVVDAYITKTASLAKEPACDINYVYTAMHGVGYEVLSKTLAKAGLPQPHVADRLARWHILNSELPNQKKKAH